MVPEWVEDFYYYTLSVNTSPEFSERTAESFKVIGEVSHAFKVQLSDIV